MIRKTLAASLFVLTVAGFAGMASAAEKPVPERYVDAFDWPTADAGMDRFAAAEAKLVAGFDSVCADTFCEGDFSNLRPMDLRCSVDSTKSTLKQCVWTFAGSSSSVNRKTGAVATTARLFKCKFMLAKNTPIEAFYEVMNGDDPLNAKLPMSRHSVYDSVSNCLY